MVGIPNVPAFDGVIQDLQAKRGTYLPAHLIASHEDVAWTEAYFADMPLLEYCQNMLVGSYCD